jgi:hypothetical protein
MKKLEQWVQRGRALARSARAVAPGAARAHRPVRLVLRLNDIALAPGLLRATGQPLTRAEWHDAIARVVRWLGPVRVTVAGGEPARSPRLEDLVRYSNRLECPTHLVTSGPLEQPMAEALIDRGLGAVTVLVGGVDEATHQSVVGGSLADATTTVEAFRAARKTRTRPLGVYVGVPLRPENAGSVAAVGGWARQAGADAVLATLPLGVEPPEGALQAVQALGRDNSTPKHLITFLQGRQPRVRGGLRLELLSDGTLAVSSHVAPLGNVRDGDPKDLWEAAEEQIRSARSHPRPWDEVELVPERLFSER